MSRYQVFDAGILTVSNVELGTTYPEARETTLELFLFRGEAARAWFTPGRRRLVVSRPGVGGHTLQILLAYLMGFRSSRFAALHAGGCVVEGRGALVVGRHRAGKSALLQALPTERILDEDVMVVDRQTMYSTGANVEEPHAVDAIFLLRPDRRGGELVEMDRHIPRVHAVFDSLPPPLQTDYARLAAVSVAAPVYELGTRGGVRRTRDALRRALGTGPQRYHEPG